MAYEPGGVGAAVARRVVDEGAPDERVRPLFGQLFVVQARPVFVDSLSASNAAGGAGAVGLVGSSSLACSDSAVVENVGTVAAVTLDASSSLTSDAAVGLPAKHKSEALSKDNASTFSEVGP